MKITSSVTALLLLMCSAVSSAQQGTGTTKKGASVPLTPPPRTAQKPIQLKPATVSGHIFALTKGGDLKPVVPLDTISTDMSGRSFKDVRKSQAKAEAAAKETAKASAEEQPK